MPAPSQVEGTANPAWLRYDAAARRLSLTLHAQPNAKKSAITGLHADALKVRVAAPAEGNRANDELLALLARSLEVPRSSVTLRHGASGRRKVVEITGGPDLRARAARLASVT